MLKAGCLSTKSPLYFPFCRPCAATWSLSALGAGPPSGGGTWCAAGSGAAALGAGLEAMATPASTQRPWRCRGRRWLAPQGRPMRRRAWRGRQVRLQYLSRGARIAGVLAEAAVGLSLGAWDSRTNANSCAALMPPSAPLRCSRRRAGRRGGGRQRAQRAQRVRGGGQEARHAGLHVAGARPAAGVWGFYLSPCSQRTCAAVSVRIINRQGYAL